MIPETHTVPHMHLHTDVMRLESMDAASSFQACDGSAHKTTKYKRNRISSFFHEPNYSQHLLSILNYKTSVEQPLVSV